MNDLLSKRLVDFTGNDLVELLSKYLELPKPKVENDYTKDNKRYVYGLGGIADLFRCSKTTANRIKQSGKIDGAITQVGNIIVVEAEKALELAGKKNVVIKKK